MQRGTARGPRARKKQPPTAFRRPLGPGSSRRPRGSSTLLASSAPVVWESASRLVSWLISISVSTGREKKSAVGRSTKAFSFRPLLRSKQACATVHRRGPSSLSPWKTQCAQRDRQQKSQWLPKSYPFGWMPVHGMSKYRPGSWPQTWNCASLRAVSGKRCVVVLTAVLVSATVAARFPLLPFPWAAGGVFLQAERLCVFPVAEIFLLSSSSAAAAGVDDARYLLDVW